MKASRGVRFRSTVPAVGGAMNKFSIILKKSCSFWFSFWFIFFEVKIIIFRFFASLPFAQRLSSLPFASLRFPSLPPSPSLPLAFTTTKSNNFEFEVQNCYLQMGTSFVLFCRSTKTVPLFKYLPFLALDLPCIYFIGNTFWVPQTYMQLKVLLKNLFAQFSFSFSFF